MESAESITYRVTFTADDYSQAQMLATSRQQHQRWLFFIPAIVFGIVLLSAMVFSKTHGHAQTAFTPASAMWNIVSVLITAILFLVFWLFITRKMRLWWWFILLPVIALGAIAATLLNAKHAHGSVAPHFSETTLWNFATVVLLLILFVAFFLMVKKIAQKGATALPECEVTLDDAGIHAQSPTEQSLIRWDQYKHALENEHMFLLVDTLKSSLMRYFIIPKRAIPDDAMQGRLRALVERHVGPINTKVSFHA